MCSSRTRGTESLNSENLLANWLPFGATTIMRRGDEYYNIFGAWDWSKIPGVTNPAITVSWPINTTSISTQTTSFVGAVSDGTYGVTAMDYNKVTDVNGQSVDIAARKANFLFNNEMICLGAGITSSYALAPTTTTLNQSYLKGAVLINGVAVPQDEKSYDDVKWVHHDNTGYVFRNNTIAKMKTNSQSGNWYSINRAQTNETVTADVFKLWLDHGAAPSNASYEYAVLPNFSASETLAYANNMPIETVLNTTLLQAVTHKTLRQTGAVFYTAGTLNIDATLRITVDAACVLLIDWGSNPIKITASDPNQNRTTLNVMLNYNDWKSETLVFSLPSSNAKGASLTKVAETVRIINSTSNILEFQREGENSEDIEIYPSPSLRKFNVKLSERFIGGRINVINIIGNVLFSINTASSENAILLDNNYKGIGLVVVEKDGRKVVRKIVVE
jgi:chondroitin AC lyase